MNIIEGTVTDPAMDPAELKLGSFIAARAKFLGVLNSLEAPELGGTEYVNLLKELHEASDEIALYLNPTKVAVAG